MAGRDLARLLAGLTVFRHPGTWQFTTGTHPPRDAVMCFREREGWTGIVPAAPSAPEEARFAWIELAVHSDLNAVGFLAAIAAALAAAGIPCNAVAAFHHDHVFVPETSADDAIRAIEALGKP